MKSRFRRRKLSRRSSPNNDGRGGRWATRAEPEQLSPLARQRRRLGQAGARQRTVWNVKVLVFLTLAANPHRDESAADDDSEHESRDKILHIFSSHVEPASGSFFRLRRDIASPKGTVFVKRHLALFVRVCAHLRCIGSLCHRPTIAALKPSAHNKLRAQRPSVAHCRRGAVAPISRPLFKGDSHFS